MMLFGGGKASVKSVTFVFWVADKLQPPEQAPGRTTRAKGGVRKTILAIICFVILKKV